MMSHKYSCPGPEGARAALDVQTAPPYFTWHYSIPSCVMLPTMVVYICTDHIRCNAGL